MPKRAEFRSWLRRRTVVGPIRPGALAVAALALAALAGPALAVPLFASPPLVLVWNVTASVPVGLYGLRGAGEVELGDLVAARLPDPARQLAAERRYVPASLPVIKRVAALPGDVVCMTGARVRVNGAVVALRRSRDRMGRRLPQWRGCAPLAQGQLLLLGDDPGSFDGRYFGPISRERILGEARLLWRS